MKRLICVLLLILALALAAGCRAERERSAAGTAVKAVPAATAAPQTEPAVLTTEPPETAAPTTAVPETEPVETVPPETEPPVLADCVEMVLSGPVTVTPDEPVAAVRVSFPRVELPADAGRCSLTLELDGRPWAEWPSLELTPGLEEQAEQCFSFSLRDEDREIPWVATLRLGDQTLRRGGVIVADNDDPERYYAKSGESYPYSIDVIRSQNVVIVYGLEDGEYSFPVKAWLCSTGWSTPRGNYRLGGKQEWGALFGGVWGQYVCGIWGNILFHSVPYYYRSKDCLKTGEYNKLGTEASMGCVRLPVEGAKWIFDNCPYGTDIHIYDAEELPIPRPTSIWLDPEDPRSCWDPTDPDPDSPWNEQEDLSFRDKGGKRHERFAS